jgi:hypothetical protein
MKQKMFLSGRGFSYKTIEYALNEYWKKWILEIYMSIIL